MLKADKKKWHLVQAVNEVVEDFVAEVPNPHTLLSNVPPDARYFSVIDLCSGQDVFETEKTELVPQPCSAQKAELKALIEACNLPTGKAANIYTDSAYAYGVCHLFGAVWKQRGFKKTDGLPILHLQLLLLTPMMLPKRLAIIKCQPHKRDGLNITNGNLAAEEAAKRQQKAHGLY